jgi:serine phosphatase RsbU (regulator of sigma subunit)
VFVATDLVQIQFKFLQQHKMVGGSHFHFYKKKESQSKISYLFIILIVKFINILENAVGDKKKS